MKPSSTRQLSRAQFLRAFGLSSLAALMPTGALNYSGIDVPAVSAQDDPIEKLFAESFVIDGVVVPDRSSSDSSIPTRPGEIKQLVGINMGGTDVTGVDLASAVNLMNRWDNFIQRFGNALIKIKTASDIDTAQTTGRYGVIHYAQDPQREFSSQLKGSVQLLAQWKSAGLRILQIAYSNGNDLGGGDYPETNDQPLTPLGKQVIQELNRLRMVIDLSHTGKRTTLDVVELTSQLVTANHTSAERVNICSCPERAFSGRPHPRSKSDEELKAIAKTGGVIGVTIIGRFIERAPMPRSIDDFVAHVDYIVQLVGIDHVGFSSDASLDGSIKYPQLDYVDQYLNSPQRWKHVVRRLSEKGYKREDLQKLMGLNFKRVYQQVLDP
ncbi:membrane dipeptidase [Candidatus Acetothermia bacterium]|nr:membrane dipeptidase [Candidatus Acetothermia bacterium]